MTLSDFLSISSTEKKKETAELYNLLFKLSHQGSWIEFFSETSKELSDIVPSRLSLNPEHEDAPYRIWSSVTSHTRDEQHHIHNDTTW